MSEAGRARSRAQLRIGAAAVDVIASVSENRLRRALVGERVYVPVTLMRKLAEAVEELYPGVIADVRSGRQ